MAANEMVTAKLNFSVDGEANFDFNFAWKDIPLSLAITIESVLVEALKVLNDMDKARMGIK